MKSALTTTLAGATQRVRVTDTSALVADQTATTLSAVISLRRARALAPYRAEVWQSLLERSNLISKYPRIVHSLFHGFDIGIPRILSTHTPFNSPSIREHFLEFRRIVDHEFACQRYIGPFTKAEVEAILGPFQTSPLSLVPKPHKPNTFRLVQDYSYPRKPVGDHTSINSHIDASDYPCTWGTFAAFARLILSMPPGSQGAVRDVSEAYRTVPVTPVQWAGMVIRLSNDKDEYVIDTQAYFGGTANGGVFGSIADACADIMRAYGLGPISKWVDDHVFFRILREHLDKYNERRRQWKVSIQAQGGEHRNGGRKWYGGQTRSNGTTEEFDEDMAFPVQDLSQSSPRGAKEKQFSCSMNDIDTISEQLGIPWEKEKDQPWSSKITFTGFVWDIENKTAALSESKRVKYVSAIENWNQKKTHTLKEVQKLYGKLLHTSAIHRPARAYLTRLEAMLGIFHDTPFKPRHPPRHTEDDLDWWTSFLSSPHPPSPLVDPDSFVKVNAFSDASSKVGIGIVTDDCWRAWKLKPGWQTDGRDIAWAEAVGFELLTYSLLSSCRNPRNITIFGDNQSIIEAWKNGRSRSWQVNVVFRRIHSFLQQRGCNIHVEYVRSEDNPADEPSRGVFLPKHLLLPAQPIDPSIQRWVEEYDFGSIHPSRFQRRGPAKPSNSRHGSNAFDHRSINIAENSSEHGYIAKLI